MNTAARAIAFLIPCLSFGIAHADWAYFGAAAGCKQNEFELVATVETSDPENAGTMSTPRGYLELPTGTRDIRCAIGGVTVDTRLTVHGASKGKCMGGGYVAIQSLVIAGHKILPRDGPYEPFNWTCSTADPAIVRIRVLPGPSDVRMEICTASRAWEWGVGYTGITCHDMYLAR